MAYRGLAAFEAEAEADPSMKVKPGRRQAWIVAVNSAEKAIHLDRLKRIRLLTDMYETVPRKAVSSPKKSKRSYQSEGGKGSAAGGNRSSMSGASPPLKKFRRKASMSVEQVSDGLLNGHVPLSSPSFGVPSPAVWDSISWESATAVGESAGGKRKSRVQFTRVTQFF